MTTRKESANLLTAGGRGHDDSTRALRADQELAPGLPRS